jgi:putative acetyltransferase
MLTRALTAADRPQLDALLAAFSYPPNADGGAWTSTPSGEAHHTLGLWQQGALVAAARLAPGTRTRTRHTVELSVVHGPSDPAAALWLAVVAFVDAWTAFDRIQANLPADSVAVDAARAAGFEVEVRRVRRIGDQLDELALGRLRPGWSPRPPGPPPAWPARRPGAPSRDLQLRPLTDDDAPAVHALSTEPTSVWGTLQTPTSSVDFYAARHRATPTGHRIFLAEVDGAAVGVCGLHPTPHDGVFEVGMAIGVDHQGVGLGRRALHQLVDAACAAGARRVELSVFTTNTRARALYERAGFVVEGTRRADGIQAGGYADSVEMARFPDR